jgi:hypothetical protein
MTGVRIAAVEPWPGRLPDGGFAISEFLLVLADHAGSRALPVWLAGPDGRSVWQLVSRPADGDGPAGVTEELAVRMLGLAGAEVSGVDIDELSADVTRPPQSVGGDRSRPGAAARISLACPAGPRHVTARLGFGLALAAAAEAPIRVAEAVMGELSAAAEPGELPARFLPRMPAPRSAPHWWSEAGNLDFADGLDRWDFGGSFRRDPDTSRHSDYSCATHDGAATIACEAAAPAGFAALTQTIAADDYRDGSITFRAELRLRDVAGTAALHLMAGPGPGRVASGRLSPPQQASLQLAGSHGWTSREVSVDVRPDAGVIRFGVILAGPGRVEMRGAGLSPGPREVAGGATRGG